MAAGLEVNNNKKLISGQHFDNSQTEWLVKQKNKHRLQM